VTANIAWRWLRWESAVSDADIECATWTCDGPENRIVYISWTCQRAQDALGAHQRQAAVEPYRFAAQTRDKSAVKPADLVRVCDQLRLDHDFILIDSAAGIEEGFRTAMTPADLVLIVTNPEVSAVRDADRVIGLVEAAEKDPAKLIVNRLKPAMVSRGDMLDTADVLEILAVELIGIVPEDESAVLD
jgi:septum site-determining protein MinD